MSDLPKKLHGHWLCPKAVSRMDPEATRPEPPKSTSAAEPKCDLATRYQKYDGVRRANVAGTLCRHCRKATVNRPRGLCWSCYYTPGVKDLYPSTSKYARRGVGHFAGTAPLDPFPTTAAPGTPEKMAVLDRRAKSGMALFHPDDSTGSGEPGVPLQAEEPYEDG